MSRDLSIIIPVHNQASVIGNALDSIQRQRGIAPEIIVVDDASDDDLASGIEKWQAANPNAALAFVRLAERAYALGSRLAGIRAANASDIMFVDADDRLAGTDALAEILRRKKEAGAEIVHFPSVLKDGQGNLLGNAYFDLPLASGLIGFEEKLEKYVARSWPPSELWGKIYSRELLLRVIPWLAPEKVYRLDVILSTLAMFAAQSYLGCDEFAYEYTMRDEWPVLKLAQRMHDSLVNEKSINNMLSAIPIPEKCVDAWKHGFADYFLVWNAGKMSFSFNEAESSGESAEKLLAEMESVLSMDELLAQTLFSTQSNIAKIVALLDRMHHVF